MLYVCVTLLMMSRPELYQNCIYSQNTPKGRSICIVMGHIGKQDHHKNMSIQTGIQWTVFNIELLILSSNEKRIIHHCKRKLNSVCKSSLHFHFQPVVFFLPYSDILSLTICGYKWDLHWDQSHLHGIHLYHCSMKSNEIGVYLSTEVIERKMDDHLCLEAEFWCRHFSLVFQFSILRWNRRKMSVTSWAHLSLMIFQNASSYW